MRKSTRALRFVLAAGGAALLPAAVRASGSGSIDTTGATLSPGSAPVPGEVVIEEGVDLGEPPAVGGMYPNGFNRYPGNYPNELAWPSDRPGVGFGGPDFRAQVDVTLPGGTYDFANFDVDPGVVVTFTGNTTVRVSKDASIEGRVEMTGASEGDRLAFRVAGELVVAGRSGLPCGFVADDDGAELFLDVQGDVTVTADANAEPLFSAAGAGGRVWILASPVDQSVPATLDAAGARFVAGSYTAIRSSSKLTLDGCSAEGLLQAAGREPVVYECDRNGDCADTDDDTVGCIVRGGRYTGGLTVVALGGDLRVEEACAVEGDACRLFATGPEGEGGTLTIESGCSIQVARRITLAAEHDLEIGEGCPIRTTDGGDALIVTAIGDLTIGAGATIEHAGGSGYDSGAEGALVLSSAGVLRVAGTVRGEGPEVRLAASRDVVLEDGAAIDGRSSALLVGARGAVVAEDGNAVVTAGNVEIRCSTGDLDLDLRSLSATTGQLATLSNGRVRLRGTYRAARDIQVISLADVVSVAGATLSTDDVTDGLSGFVRLATYGSPTTVIIGGDLPADGEDEEDADDDDGEAEKMRTASADDGTVLINASDATLRTGDSDAQSGSILLQNQEGEAQVSRAASLRVTRAATRRRDGAFLTQIRGTLQVPRRRLDFSGSGRLAAGTVDERMLLEGRRGAFRGEGRAASVRFARATSTRPAFVFEIREPAAAQAGETSRVGFHRAGLHVRGTFRRPKTR